MRVVIDARVAGGLGGGVETLVKGLAKGFSEIQELDFELIFLVEAGKSNLFSEFEGQNYVKLVETKTQNQSLNLKRRLRGFLRLLSYHANIPLPDILTLTRDRAIEGLRPSVVHYPYQATFFTQFPTVYHPHDLQHKYFPKNFSALTRLFRDANYSIMCQKSAAIVVSSNWVKQDLTRFYGINPMKVFVVPLSANYKKTSIGWARMDKDLNCTDSQPTFLLYPAVNWPHKNHSNLLRAIQLLIHDGLDIRLVCTGRVLDRFKSPQVIAEELGIEKNIFVLGHVGQELLDEIYYRASAVVVPTKFEAASFPIYEAQARGKAVACSNATSLPEQVKDSALIFDPENITEIAEVIRYIWTDEELRIQLEAKSLKNVAENTWVDICKSFASIYREISS